VRNDAQLKGAPPSGTGINIDAVTIFRIVDGKVGEESTLLDV
jgi:hypothetical protein